MPNVPFTRDEVILALDVLFFSGDEHFSTSRPSIIELSALLNELPIHPEKVKKENFRNPAGIRAQVSRFKSGLSDPNIRFPVGDLFYEVYNEFSEDLNRIHFIAEAIRRNREAFSLHFGDPTEAKDFPEGALLAHLHKHLEIRDSKKLTPSESCDICRINFDELYKPIKNGLLEFHLTTPITELDFNKKYRETDFITVCPTCHAMLHKYRPWVSKDKITNILR